MKKIIVMMLIVPILSCSGGLPFLSSDNSLEIPKPDNVDSNYILIQKQVQTLYTLQKALNAGLIDEEEYTQLKRNLFTL